MGVCNEIVILVNAWFGLDRGGAEWRLFTLKMVSRHDP